MKMSKIQNTPLNMQESKDTKKPAYKMTKAEEPGYWLEDALRGLVAPLPRGRRIYQLYKVVSSEIHRFFKWVHGLGLDTALVRSWPI